MYFHEVSRDSESQSEPAMLARSRAIGLTKSFKHVRQKLLADALARVSDTHLSGTTNSRYLHANTSATLSKLHRVRQQVPNHLLEPVCIARDHCGVRVEMFLDL